MISHQWSLFWKFLIGISGIVILFGLAHAIIVRNSVENSLGDEFDRRGNFISRALAEQAAAYILSDDRAGLNMLINEIMAIDETIHYAFVIDADSTILAHSFSHVVPTKLLEINTPENDQEVSVITVRDKQNPGLVFRDYSKVAISKNLGTARIGIVTDDIQKSVQATMHSLWYMVAVFLFVGLISAFFFSYIIARPLEVLSGHSRDIDLENIREGLKAICKSKSKPYYRIRRMFGLKDEIDVLYENYVNMLNRLAEAYSNMHRLQQSLLQSEKLASIGTLTAGVAHEINNPLAGLSIGLKRIRKNPGNLEQTENYISLMEESLSKMQRVIKDLLAFSRKDDLLFENREVKELLEKSVQLAQYRIKKHDIVIRLDDKLDGVYLRIAPNRMEQVFLNIIINAIDAISESIQQGKRSKGTISIFATIDDKRVCFVFEDNGLGMEAGEIRKIFDPFYTTKDVGQGTGLGLSVAYQIVKDHGGEISAESEPGKGSRFYVCLPNTTA